VDNDWWTIYYPTEEWTNSSHAESLLKAWIKNGVGLEKYPWTKIVSERIGLINKWNQLVEECKDEKNLQHIMKNKILKNLKGLKKSLVMVAFGF